MKKILLLVYLVSIVSFYGYSQMHLSLSDSSGVVANNATITIPGLPSTLSMDTYMFVTNNTDSPMSVKLRKVEVSAIHGTENYFCWGACYGSNVFESPTPVIIQGLETNHFDFSAHYTPFDSIGVTKMRYVFFNVADLTDTVCFNVNFDTRPQGVPNVNAKKDFSLSSYPNPASSYVNLDYSLPQGNYATLEIRNLLGIIVKYVSLSQASGRVNVETSELANGVYFCSVVQDGQPVVTRKLTVKH